MADMRAKFKITNINQISETQEQLNFSAVTEAPFDAEGASEDNSFAKFTPDGHLTMMVTNPNLIGKFAVGEKYYLDFIKAE